MADKLELPNSVTTKIVKEGAIHSLSSNGQSGGVILGKETK